MKKVVKLNESDLHRIVERVISEEIIKPEDRKKMAIKYAKEIYDHTRKLNIKKWDFTFDVAFLMKKFKEITDDQNIKVDEEDIEVDKKDINL